MRCLALKKEINATTITATAVNRRGIPRQQGQPTTMNKVNSRLHTSQIRFAVCGGNPASGTMGSIVKGVCGV